MLQFIKILQVKSYTKMALLVFVLSIFFCSGMLFSRGTSNAPWAHEYNWALDFCCGSVGILSGVAAAASSFLVTVTCAASGMNYFSARNFPAKIIFSGAFFGFLPTAISYVISSVLASIIVASNGENLSNIFVWPEMALVLISIVSWSVIGAVAALAYPRTLTSILCGILPFLLFVFSKKIPGAGFLAFGGSTGDISSYKMNWEWVLGSFAFYTAVTALILSLYLFKEFSNDKKNVAIGGVGVLLSALFISAAFSMNINGSERFTFKEGLPSYCSIKNQYGPTVCVWPDSGLNPKIISSSISPYARLTSELNGGKDVTYYQQGGITQTNTGQGVISAPRGDGSSDNIDAMYLATTSLQIRQCPSFAGYGASAYHYGSLLSIASFYLQYRVSGKLPEGFSKKQYDWIKSSDSQEWTKNFLHQTSVCNTDRMAVPSVWQGSV